MPVLEWHDAARADLLAIVDYISDHNPDAAQQLKDDIEAKVAKLPEFPRMYRPGRVEGTREMLVRANYIVVYHADPITVRVLRVLHAAQQWPMPKKSTSSIPVEPAPPHPRAGWLSEIVGQEWELTEEDRGWINMEPMGKEVWWADEPD